MVAEGTERTEVAESTEGTEGTEEALPKEAEALGRQALEWLLRSAKETGTGTGSGIGTGPGAGTHTGPGPGSRTGLVWTDTPSDNELDFDLYSGTAGIIPALLEGRRHFGDDRYGDAALRAARTIEAAVAEWEASSLYGGLAGMAVALHAVHTELGDKAAGAAADRALVRVRERFDGTRWGDLFELIGGNAGIALGALAVGDTELAVLAVTPYLRTAEPTAGGVHWEVRAGTPARFHHISHGTLGIVHALAAVGRAANRPDLVELAVDGASDVVARNEADAEGFLVPHSDPQHKPDIIERYSYGWCHGPAGDAQTFRLLGSVLQDPSWSALADRCWHTVTHSGLPERLRPGFWDNSGRCCGTAGVLALACDRSVEQRDGLDFARVLVADIASRATVDEHGARWSNIEHRVNPSVLEPRNGWAMGNAGILRELLRFARIGTGRDAAYAVDWPDQPAAVARSGEN
ncbi:lanthionine synthetase C family protein [Streptomyces sp. NBC_01387]|uniref:lanthionine synthetase LanC family protein n=1 Tax=Streptomyces sp. NBC_01387 TaxID=2903849 RepID=UPI003250D31D